MQQTEPRFIIRKDRSILFAALANPMTHNISTMMTQSVFGMKDFAAINAAVAQMDNAIQPVPPTPFFDDLTAEEAALLQTTLYDAFEVWNDAFLTGKKSIEADWDAYVQEMTDKGIEQFCGLYNEYKH